jgi:hypothetical protein
MTKELELKMELEARRIFRRLATAQVSDFKEAILIGYFMAKTEKPDDDAFKPSGPPEGNPTG